MSRTLGRISGLILAATLLAVATVRVTARADELLPTGPNGEMVSVSMRVAPASGPLYRSGAVPAKLGIDVAVTVPPAATMIAPTINGTVRLPGDLAFRPKRSMPVCTDARMGPDTDLSIPPHRAIALCLKSVIGNGTALLHLAGVKGAPVEAVLVIFHAGWTRKGMPKVKIWGYAKGVNAGVLMRGSLTPDNSISTDVPVLPLQTAIGSYTLNVPGDGPIVYNGRRVAGSRGLDPAYVMASCPRGVWPVSAAATLGERDDSGALTSPEYRIQAPDVFMPCKARPGEPPLGSIRVKGPSRVKRGASAKFRITIRNRSQSAAARVRVTVRGKGVRRTLRIGTIPGRQTGTGEVRVKVRKRGKTRLVFTASARGRSRVSADRQLRVR